MIIGLIKRVMRSVLEETPREERARRRKEVGSHCADVFCLDDPCRYCPNYNYHQARWPDSHKRMRNDV